jgi:alpha-L-fucosidase
MKFKIFTLLAFFQAGQAFAQTNDNWFQDAKFGIFIHWGIYSVKGIDESWSFHNKKIQHSDYMAQAKGFTAKNYNPTDWANLIEQSGAKYAVVTSKHHDGVALWDTKVPYLNTPSKQKRKTPFINSIPKTSPAGRDVYSPLIASLQHKKIKIGIYYSLIDWSHPCYPGFLKDSTRYKIADDAERWNVFKTYNEAQIMELRNAYNPDLWWFDGGWEHSAKEWNAFAIRDSLVAKNKNVFINNRLPECGNYETPENSFPIHRNEKPWELCLTLNTNWGWQPQDTAFKTPEQIIHILTDVVSLGGNLLLDIGPKEDGTFPPQVHRVIEETGTWLNHYGAAIYGTRAGLPREYCEFPTTLSANGHTLFVFVPNGIETVYLKGLLPKIKSAFYLDNDARVSCEIIGKISWSSHPGLVSLKTSGNGPTPYARVIALDLEESLWNDEGKMKLDELK